MKTRAWLLAIVLAVVAAPTESTAQRAPAGIGRSIAVDQLPPEARTTIALIRRGGPFAHARDGATFGNREARLPRQARGYYREYTVRTPGERTRGARRIVAGRDGEYFYTDDHYDSFRRVRE